MLILLKVNNNKQLLIINLVLNLCDFFLNKVLLNIMLFNWLFL